MTDETSDKGGTPVDRLLRFRREFLKRAFGVGAAAATVGLVGRGEDAEAQGVVVNDTAILNFALNLEYLEAEFYNLGVYGMSIEQMGVATSGANGPAGGLIVKANPMVPFVTPLFQQYAVEIASDERNHVNFLRSAIAGGGFQPASRPLVNLLDSFNTAAQLSGLGPTFDPFLNENNFLVGSFVFEDVGVTAYHGAARLIKNKDYLDAAAGILAVEAYHAAEVRTLMLSRGLVTQAAAISALRAAASNAADDQGITDSNGNANIVPTDGNSLAYDRTTSQVLSVVYLGGTTGGGFFPNGLNGVIR